MFCAIAYVPAEWLKWWFIGSRCLQMSPEKLSRPHQRRRDWYISQRACTDHGKTLASRDCSILTLYSPKLSSIFFFYKLAEKSFGICAIRSMRYDLSQSSSCNKMLFPSMNLCYTLLSLIQLCLINNSKSFIRILLLSSGLGLSQMGPICHISHRSFSSFTGLRE